MVTQQEKKIIDTLKAKANSVAGTRMPQLKVIAELLKSNGITDFSCGVYRFTLKGNDWQPTHWTTYSANTWQYARQVLDAIGVEF